MKTYTYSDKLIRPGRDVIYSTVKLLSSTGVFTKKMKEARVLSIQSYVVHGYVGNKSAVFPMQVLGLEVDAINSVQFSNHTGYKYVKGQILTEKDLATLMEGLTGNGLDNYTHLLTGYIGSESFLKQVVSVLEQLKIKNPNITYVCDPVMGDNGAIYVPKELLPIYKELVVKSANILTPNLFELQLLTDINITGVADVWTGINILHAKGCEVVIISSADIPGKPDLLMVFASSKKDGKVEKYDMEIKKMPMNFTGTGDLFSSLILSWMYKTKNNLKQSLENTIGTLQAVLKRTYEAADGLEPGSKNKELKLVQSKCDIEEPKIIYQARLVD